MSAQVFGINPGDIKPQPDFVARQSENNTWEANQTFLILKDDLDNDAVRARFTQGVTLLSLWPECPIIYQSLVMVTSNPRNAKGGLVEVACLFTGAAFNTYGTDPSSSTQGIPTYTLEGSLSEVGIEQHPSVSVLSDNDKTILGGMIHAGWTRSVFGEIGEVIEGVFYPNEEYTEVSAGTATDFALLIKYGTTTYQKASFIWRETRQGKTALTSNEIDKLGRIDSGIPGSPPNPFGGNANWMLVGATQELQGEVYNITREWMLSESEGWDTTLYT